MKLDREFVDLLSISFRIMFLSCAFTWMSWRVIETLLGKCLHPVLLLSYLLTKQCLTGPILDIILRHYYGHTDEWVAVNTLVTMIVFFLNFIIFTYSFSGGLVKVFLGICATETLCHVCLFPCLFLVNWMEGRDILTYGAPFQGMDVLAALLSWATVGLIHYLAGAWMKRFQNYQIRHKKLLGTIILVYAVSVQQVSFTDMTDGQSLLFIHYFHFGCVGMIVFILLLFCGEYRRSVLRRRSFLSMRQQLMESHYQAVREQIMGMEHSQRIIGDQMKEIIRMEPNAAGGDRIAEYLSHLKREYQEIRAGIYCDDWMTDAVLYCQAERAKKAGIRVQYNMQGFDRGKIEEEDLVRLLFGLLDWGLKQNEKILQKKAGIKEIFSRGNVEEISLRASAVGSRLLIIFETYDFRNSHPPQRLVQKCVRKYNGEMTVEFVNERRIFTIGLMRG